MASCEQLLPEQAQCPAPFYGGPQLQEVCSANGLVLFLSLLNALVANNQKINDPCGRITPVKKTDYYYSFIVVGSGPAGATVAARLSEGKHKVLLLEAGKDEPPASQIPSNLQLFLGTELDWQYKTTNESFACLSTNGSCSWPRGKNLGGCTAHHGMAYHRGHAKDYQRWVDMGNEGWSWDDVLPIFKRAENNREIGRVDAEFHGTGGYLTVERFPYQPPMAWDILAAADAVGIGTTEDLVGKKITGFTVAQTISRDGVRLSSSRASLWPARNRKNLHISTESYVVKILTSNNRAVGVQYLKGNKLYTVRVKHEVIVCGGTINSPHLLMLSGIGPAEHLRSHGIQVVVDLPGVGKNLHNHVSYGLDYTIDEPDSPDLNTNSADEYLYNQTGPLSCTGLAQVTGMTNSRYNEPDDPDLQFFHAGFQAICPTGDRIADLESYDNKKTVRFTAVNVQTKSRGQITLASNNPLDPPIIWSNELSEDRDVDGLREAMKIFEEMTKALPLRKYNLTMVEPKVPACSHLTWDSSEYWTCVIRYDTRPENHQAGTCKMGPANDTMAVVDSRLKVHGMVGLRVADASIMPQVVSGNPHAPIAMIGDKAADMIIADFGQ